MKLNEGLYSRCPKLYGKIWLLVWLPLGKYSVVSNRLSKTIQKLETSAIEAQSLAKSILIVLVSDRSDESFQLFWERVQLSKANLDVDDTQVSRKRKVPSRFKTGKRESHHYHENPEDKYNQVYYEAFDRIIACIRERFEQKDYQVYAKIKEILCFLPFTNKNDQKMLSIVSILSMVSIFVKHN